MKKSVIAMLLPAMMAVGCHKTDETIITAPSVEVIDGQMSPEVLEAFGRISKRCPARMVAE